MTGEKSFAFAWVDVELAVRVGWHVARGNEECEEVNGWRLGGSRQQAEGITQLERLACWLQTYMEEAHWSPPRTWCSRHLGEVCASVLERLAYVKGVTAKMSLSLWPHPGDGVSETESQSVQERK